MALVVKACHWIIRAGHSIVSIEASTGKGEKRIERISTDSESPRNEFLIAEAEGTLPPHDGYGDQRLN